jgi:hypothetical protein
MLKITDLMTNKEMDSKEMTEVRGGFNPFATFDSSTSIDNKVAEVNQAFNFALGQGNAGQVINNQAIAGGNGPTWAPVDQDQYQYNDMYLTDIGNVSVS